MTVNSDFEMDKHQHQSIVFVVTTQPLCETRVQMPPEAADKSYKITVMYGGLLYNGNRLADIIYGSRNATQNATSVRVHNARMSLAPRDESVGLTYDDVMKHVNNVWLQENTFLLDFEKDFELRLVSNYEKMPLHRPN